MEIEVAKLHGLGNSYVVIEDLSKKMQSKYPSIARVISNINRGIGSDGLLVVNKGKLAKYHMRVFNPNGSESEMSGNGARIFTGYLFDKNLIGKKATFEAGGKKGGKLVSVSVEKKNYVTVDFGNGKIIGEKTVKIGSKSISGTYISVGNPHFVVFEPNEKTARESARKYGPILEHHRAFKQTNGANIEFVYIKNKSFIVLHVWERDAGLTLACGSGACAAALASYKKGKTSGKVTARLPGGNLSIKIDNRHNIFLSGPVEHIFSGILNLNEVLANTV